MYRHLDALMLRAPAMSGVLAAGWPTLDGDPEGLADEWVAWLHRVWADDQFVHAITYASPTLAGRLTQVRAGHRPTPRQGHRLVMSTLRYLLRASGRATPFGLFAGIAPARTGQGTKVAWGDRRRVVAAADAAWLRRVIAGLERDPELRQRLTVVANRTCYVRGDRLVVPQAWQTIDGGEEEQVGELSIRHTRPVEQTLRLAGTPIRVQDLVVGLATEYGCSSAATLQVLVAELITRRILLHHLEPPMTATDPLHHLLEQLANVGADTIAAVAPTVRVLKQIRADPTFHNTSTDAATGHRLRVAVTERMTQLYPTKDRGLAVDLVLDCELTIPEQVVLEAEAAATTLTRLSRHPTGFANWRRYHNLFLDRYGPGAVVPLLELVNPDVGLGYPAGYRDSPHSTDAQQLTERDELLLAWAQQAALDGATEITLDPQAITTLGGEPPATVAASAELTVRVHAASSERLDRGDFQLVVTGVSRAAGTTTGRFWRLLPPADRDRMIAAHAALPTSHTGALAVQVSAPPLAVRARNVARTPAILPVINLGEHPGPGFRRLPLEELAVTGDIDDLRLATLRDGSTVEPTVFHALELANHTHPLARFLCEITRARAAACTSFSWGAAERLPFLPRIRHGRTVLAMARWRLISTDLGGSRSSWREWVAGVDRWRHARQVPRMVFVGDDDQRLRLDLAKAAHLYLLRTHLDRAGHVAVREAPTDEELGWCGGQIHEVVIPLAATTTPRRVKPVAVTATAAPNHGYLPGASAWLFARLDAHPDRHTSILTDHLPQLLAHWEAPPLWWFVRYPDPRPHLRLRLRLATPDDFGDTARRVGRWAAALRRAGLAGDLDFGTYRPETGRYGTGQTMEAAEAVFAADSAAAIAQLHASIPNHVITAASMVDLACAFTGSHDAGTAWLIEHAPRTGTNPVDRAILAQVLSFTAPSGQPHGEFGQTWRNRQQATIGYRQRLANTGHPDPDRVLASLLHLHHARMIGVNADSEHACLRLARAAALSHTRRHAAAGIR